MTEIRSGNRKWPWTYFQLRAKMIRRVGSSIADAPPLQLKTRIATSFQLIFISYKSSLVKSKRISRSSLRISKREKQSIMQNQHVQMILKWRMKLRLLAKKKSMRRWRKLCRWSQPTPSLFKSMACWWIQSVTKQFLSNWCSTQTMRAFSYSSSLTLSNLRLSKFCSTRSSITPSNWSTRA